MTVVLSGVAGDTTNVSPVPHLHEDGSFDYLPIPERGRDVTTEGTTYADWYMPEEGATADRYLEEIRPRGDGSLRVGDGELGDWPLHHDPNFDALTYGERRPAYVNRLRELGEGDAVFFYTGLRSDAGLHRYLVGYVVVDNVSYVGGMDEDDAREALRRHPENAHSKRFEATGEVDENLVVVTGSDGELFGEAHRISRRSDNGHYYLREGLAEELGPRADEPYLGGVKQAHTFGVSTGEFLDAVSREVHSR